MSCELETNRNFLYEWWPIVRRRNLYRRLAAAQVELKSYKSGPTQQGSLLEK
jgi:hypothetical protein